MRRSLVVLTAVLAVWLGTPPVAAAAVRLTPPVDGEVVRHFDAPTRFGPGHRGVDLAVPLGTPVGASAGGRVTFAGTVVGQRWVTVDHGGLRTTVGPLATIAVRRGQWVAAGAVLGTSGRAHGRAAVHWSARRGDTYVDPLAIARPRVATLVATRGEQPRGRPVPSRVPAGVR